MIPSAVMNTGVILVPKAYNFHFPPISATFWPLVTSPNDRCHSIECSVAFPLIPYLSILLENKVTILTIMFALSHHFVAVA